MHRIRSLVSLSVSPFLRCVKILLSNTVHTHLTAQKLSFTTLHFCPPPPLPTYTQAVEIFNSKANHSVQKSGHVDYVPPDAADDFDERKELLADAIKDKDIVSVDYKSI